MKWIQIALISNAVFAANLEIEISNNTADTVFPVYRVERNDSKANFIERSLLIPGIGRIDTIPFLKRSSLSICKKSGPNVVCIDHRILKKNKTVIFAFNMETKTDERSEYGKISDFFRDYSLVNEELDGPNALLDELGKVSVKDKDGKIIREYTHAQTRLDVRPTQPESYRYDDRYFYTSSSMGATLKATYPFFAKIEGLVSSANLAEIKFTAISKKRYDYNLPNTVTSAYAKINPEIFDELSTLLTIENSYTVWITKTVFTVDTLKFMFKSLNEIGSQVALDSKDLINFGGSYFSKKGDSITNRFVKKLVHKKEVEITKDFSFAFKRYAENKKSENEELRQKNRELFVSDSVKANKIDSLKTILDEKRTNPVTAKDGSSS